MNFITLYYLLSKLQPHNQVNVGICNLNLTFSVYIYQITVCLCAG